MANSRQTKIRPSERIDQIAERTYGDPFKHSVLINTNPEIDIFYPQSGSLVSIEND